MADNDQLWEVDFSGKAGKQYKKLPARIKDIIDLLIKDLKNIGPELGGWPHYGKLVNKAGELRHCHLNRKNLFMWRYGKLM